MQVTSLFNVQDNQPRDCSKGDEASHPKGLTSTWATLLANLREGITPLSSADHAIISAELVHPFTRLLFKRPPTHFVKDPKAARTNENGSSTPPNPATPALSDSLKLFSLLEEFIPCLPGDSGINVK